MDERLRDLSAKGNALERSSRIVDFKVYWPDLARAVPRSDGSKGGRPPFDLVFMFKVVLLQSSQSLSDERTAFLIKDRLSFMRFLRSGCRQGTAARAMRRGHPDGLAIGRHGDHVARRSLSVYQTIGERLAGRIGGQR